MITEGCPYFLTRQHRFGKSLLVSTPGDHEEQYGVTTRAANFSYVVTACPDIGESTGIYPLTHLLIKAISLPS